MKDVLMKAILEENFDQNLWPAEQLQAMSAEQLLVMAIRDNAQEIAVREAGEIARWQQVLAASDAAIMAARRYITYALTCPRSCGSSSDIRHAQETACKEVEQLLLNTIKNIKGEFISDEEQVGN